MSGLLLFAAALTAQSSVSVPGPNIPLIEVKDVAFTELSEGKVTAAKASLEQQLEREPSDPALLINLGASLVTLGQMDAAAKAYTAAADSGTSYRVELDDGRWMDSRRAARLALRNLDRPHSLAMR